MTSVERVAILGTGLIGTSVAAAAGRVGCAVTGWDVAPRASRMAGERSGLTIAGTMDEACADAELIVVCAPIPHIAGIVARALAAAPDAIVTDAGSVKAKVVDEVSTTAATADLPRFVGGHPMGGSERSGPEHASASLVDGIVWVLTPSQTSSAAVLDTLEDWVSRIGAQPVRMDPARHDRLVAMVSHLPQLASTSLMGLAASEEADEPEILLLAAGGFRDLTRLAASDPALWSQILLANADAITQALELYIARLEGFSRMIAGSMAVEVEAAFRDAKHARLSLATKPQVRSGVAVIQVPIPDRPGALAELTAALGEGGVNIEDLQIVHSAEGGRGMVHLTVATSSAATATSVLAARAFDPTRLA